MLNVGSIALSNLMATHNEFSLYSIPRLITKEDKEEMYVMATLCSEVLLVVLSKSVSIILCCL